MRTRGIGITALLTLTGAAACSGEFDGGTGSSGVGTTPGAPTVGEDAMMTVASADSATPTGSGVSSGPDDSAPSSEPEPMVPVGPIDGQMTESEVPEVEDTMGDPLPAMDAPEAPEVPTIPPEEPQQDPDEGDDGATDAEEIPGSDMEASETTDVEAQEQEQPAVDPPMTDHCAAVADWDPMWVQWEEEVLLLVNEARAAARSCGSAGSFEATSPLTMNGALTCAARLHSLDMYERDFFSHDNPDGVSPSQRVTDAGYEWGATGENIAYGYGSPDQVMEGWLDSDGHCSNIMSDNYTEIGVGYFPGDAGGGRFARNAHYWTQNFGAPRGSFGGGGGGFGGGGGGFGGRGQ